MFVTKLSFHILNFHNLHRLYLHSGRSIDIILQQAFISQVSDSKKDLHNQHKIFVRHVSQGRSQLFYYAVNLLSAFTIQLGKDVRFVVS